MNIAIIGCGYVGLVTGCCLAEMGHTVRCADNNRDIVDRLNQGTIHIYEPGLQELLQSNLDNKRILFDHSVEQALKNTEIIFIAVGTPSNDDNSVCLNYVFQAAHDIGRCISSTVIVVNKSTVPVGTADSVREIIQSELRKRNVTISFDVVSNPEFLKEGDAINDFMKPDRVIVGSNSTETSEKMRTLYRDFMHNHDCFIVMDVRSAELTKYAANAFLATKISFINEIANIAERVGADINQVRVGIGSDSRIGYHFIYPGCGYGGSCLPKDIRALTVLSSKSGYHAQIIHAVESANEQQKLVLVKKITNFFGEDLRDKKIAVWGLSFKPATDDMREAPSIVIIDELTKCGARVQAYDPKANKNAQQHYLRGNKNIIYYTNKYEALQDVDCVVLITNWKEFSRPDLQRMQSAMRQLVIFDGRNQYDRTTIMQAGFSYFQIGM